MTLTWTVTDPSATRSPAPTRRSTEQARAPARSPALIAGTYSATANYVGDTNYNRQLGLGHHRHRGQGRLHDDGERQRRGEVTGGSYSFTATVTGPGVTPTGTLTWTVTDPLGHAVDLRRLDAAGAGGHLLDRSRSGEHAYSATASSPAATATTTSGSALGHRPPWAKAGSTTTMTNNDGSVVDRRHLRLHRHGHRPRRDPGGHRHLDGSRVHRTRPSAPEWRHARSADAQAGTAYNVTATYRHRRQLQRLELQRQPGLAGTGRPGAPGRHLHRRQRTARRSRFTASGGLR